MYMYSMHHGFSKGCLLTASINQIIFPLSFDHPVPSNGPQKGGKCTGYSSDLTSGLSEQVLLTVTVT